jgi:putative transposase
METPTARYQAWELPEPVWQVMEPLLPVRNALRGRPRTVDLRRIAAGVFYVLRTGIQWQAVPREQFGPPTTVYYYFRQWDDAGVFAELWRSALALFDFLDGIDWEWLSLDGAMRKAPLGGEKKWSQSDGPRQAGDETQPGDRGAWDAVGDRRRGRQLSRSAVVG